MDIRNNRVQLLLDGKRMIVEPVDVEEDLFDFTGQIKTSLVYTTGAAKQIKKLDKRRFWGRSVKIYLTRSHGH